MFDRQYRISQNTRGLLMPCPGLKCLSQRSAHSPQAPPMQPGGHAHLSVTTRTLPITIIHTHMSINYHRDMPTVSHETQDPRSAFQHCHHPPRPGLSPSPLARPPGGLACAGWAGTGGPTQTSCVPNINLRKSAWTTGSGFHSTGLPQAVPCPETGSPKEEGAWPG